MINRDLDKIEIPDNIDEFIDKGINKLKREKEKKVKKHYLKVCSMIAILSIFIIGAFFNSNLASASEGNAFESIFKYFETKLLSNSKISDIETNVNQTINSNNINITIESVACDDNYISISYKVLNKDTFNIKESDIHKVSLQGQIKYTDSESSISTFTDNFSFIDENNLLIVEKYRISDLFNGEIPVDEFNLEVKLNSIEIIMVDEIDSTNKTKEDNGSWEFEVPVKKDLSESKNIDIKNIITDGTSIEDIELTPYELKITVKRDKNLPKAIVTFKDNNGNEIENISGHRINDETIIQTLNLPNVNAEYLVGYIKYVDEIHNDTCISCNDDNTHSHEIEMEEKIYLNN